MNVEFQRTARRDEKAFLNDQCKEIEENNRMGKTRGLFKKIRDNKGTFHAKLSTIKDRNGTDLTEAEGIKMWQECIEELYKKDFHDPDNHDGVITHQSHLQQSVVFALVPSLYSFWSYFSTLLQEHVGHLPSRGVHVSVSYRFAFSYQLGGYG